MNEKWLKRKKCEGPWNVLGDTGGHSELEEQLTYSFKNHLLVSGMDSLNQWDGRDELCAWLPLPSLSLCPLFLLVLFRTDALQTSGPVNWTQGASFFHSRLPVCSVLPAARPHSVHGLTHTKSIMSEWGSEGWHLQAVALVKGGSYT